MTTLRSQPLHTLGHSAVLKSLPVVSVAQFHPERLPQPCRLVEDRHVPAAASPVRELPGDVETLEIGEPLGLGVEDALEPLDQLFLDLPDGLPAVAHVHAIEDLKSVYNSRL